MHCITCWWGVCLTVCLRVCPPTASTHANVSYEVMDAHLVFVRVLVGSWLNCFLLFYFSWFEFSVISWSDWFLTLIVISNTLRDVIHEGSIMRTPKNPSKLGLPVLFAFCSCQSVEPPKQREMKGHSCRATIIWGLVCLAIGDVIYRQTASALPECAQIILIAMVVL